MKKRGDNSCRDRLIKQMKLEYLDYTGQWIEFGVLETNQTSDDDCNVAREMKLPRPIITSAVRLTITNDMASTRWRHGRIDF